MLADRPDPLVSGIKKGAIDGGIAGGANGGRYTVSSCAWLLTSSRILSAAAWRSHQQREE